MSHEKPAGLFRGKDVSWHGIPTPYTATGECLGVARGAVSDLVPGLQGGVTQALEGSEVGSALAHAPFTRAAGRCETGAALRGLEIEARVDVAQQSAASPASCVTQSNARSVPDLPCRKLLKSNWNGSTGQMAAAMKAPKTRGADRSYLSSAEITQSGTKHTLPYTFATLLPRLEYL